MIGGPFDHFNIEHEKYLKKEAKKEKAKKRKQLLLKN
jgi:hypothetical protein